MLFLWGRKSSVERLLFKGLTSILNYGMPLLQPQEVDLPCFLVCGMQIKDAVDKYLNKCRADGINDHTIRQKARLLRNFCVGKEVEDITIEDVYAYINDLHTTDEVVYRTKVHLKGLFNFLNEHGFTHLPYTLIKNKQPESKPTDCVTENDWKRIEEYLHARLHKKSYRRVHACIHILWETGLRRSELLRIKLEDLEPETFLVKTSKTGKTRRCYYNFDLTDYLKEFKPKERVFEICVNRLGEYNLKMMKDLGLKKSLHGYRAGFITRLCHNGANIQDVSRIVAHSNVNTTMRYLSTDDLYLKGICEQYSSTPRTYEFKAGMGRKQKFKIELKITKNNSQTT